jgi:hypothetical protein
MPLQNRVDPFGDIHAVAARGLFTGNRGVIHDPDTRTLLKRRWTTKAWLICDCAFRGRRRDVMGRNGPNGHAGWTELFFLDEVTALAAGHRPCFFCRRERAQDFAMRFGEAFGIDKPRVHDIDSRLHAERLASAGKRITLDRSQLTTLPDGAMVARGRDAFAIKGGKAWRWSFERYERGPDVANWPANDIALITPPTTLAVLGAGFRPTWHPSAEL